MVLFVCGFVVVGFFGGFFSEDSFIELVYRRLVPSMLQPYPCPLACNLNQDKGKWK